MTTLLDIQPFLQRAQSSTGRMLHTEPWCDTCANIVAQRHNCLTIADLADIAGVTRKTMHRWVCLGTMPVRVADRAAVNLGWHPTYLWGPDWLEAELALKR